MNIQFYKDLHRSFTRLRDAYAADVCDTDVVNAVVGELRFAKKQIPKKAHKKEKELLITIIDTLFDVLGDNDPQKMRAYLEAVGDVPTIFLGERNLYSFREQFQVFRDTYGQRYLVGIESVYPRFTKGAPKNAWEFFLPNSDDEFKAKHPVKYRWILAWGLISFFSPMITFTIFTCLIYEAPNGVGLLLGMLGCFIMGIGLFNIPAAFVHQYLGHKVTIGGIGIGLAMILISIPLSYNKTLGALFDQEALVFGVLSFSLLLISLFGYCGFRITVHSWMQCVKKIGKAHIKKLKKGYRNYWWYEALNKEYHLGFVYHLNKLYTILLALGIVLTLLLSGFRTMSPFVGIVNVLIHILDVGIFLFTQIHDTIEKYGRWPVLWHKDENKHIDSIFKDVVYVAILLELAYLQIVITMDLWGIELPRLPF